MTGYSFPFVGQVEMLVNAHYFQSLAQPVFAVVVGDVQRVDPNISNPEGTYRPNSMPRVLGRSAMGSIFLWFSRVNLVVFVIPSLL